MSRFYVGQPVRVNCPMSSCHGDETWVIALNVQIPPGPRSTFVGTQVAIPLDDQLLILVSGITHAVFEDHELEPIILPGCDAEEEETVEPEKVTA